MIENITNTIDHGTNSFIFAHRINGLTLSYTKDLNAAELSLVEWILSSYGFLLTGNFDYTPGEFANKIKDAYSLENDKNKYAFEFLNKLDKIT